MNAVRLLSAATLVALLSPACGSGDRHDPPPPDPLRPLHAFEEARRSATDFARQPASDHAFGPDPFALRLLPGSPPRFAGILRGRDALVLLDASLHELARAPAPGSPTGLAVAAEGEIFVSGEQSSEVTRYRADAGALRRTGAITFDGARAIRDVALGRARDGSEVLYAVEEHDGRLLSISLRDATAARHELRVGNGAFRVATAGDRVIVDCLLDHTLVTFRLDEHGVPSETGAVKIRHDGPIWGFSPLQTSSGLLLLAGGVEDHPLDRTGGSFGFIDSFAYLYRIPDGATEAERLAEINVSALSVITPKALLLREQNGHLAATVTGYGSDRLVEFAWATDLRLPPSVTTRPVLPGATMITPAFEGTLAIANPLFDVWLFAPTASPTLPVPEPVPEPVPDSFSPSPSLSPRDPSSKLGEALFFTKLMAPWTSSEGPLSRFTCETCHFEGYVDGRTHHTGRGDVHAVTKPLLGLFNNRPHFSRALDPDLTTVAHSEFRVAGAMSGADPWFVGPEAELPWIHELGGGDAIEPEDLRKALMTFLMEFSHRPNPAVVGRSAWTAVERRGAEVFQARCERCHSARLVNDDPKSAVPFDEWERLVVAREGAIVWANSEYERTGIVPYVHERGARVPSLRRLFKKRPYFTNGSASTVRDVITRVRVGGAGEPGVFFHDAAAATGSVEPLDAGDQEALRAFLDLL